MIDCRQYHIVSNERSIPNPYSSLILKMISFNFETKTVMLNSGVRLIDTAYMYHNEESVGEAVRNSAIPREEIFVIVASITLCPMSAPSPIRIPP